MAGKIPTESYSVVMIGAGNVGTQLSLALSRAGHNIAGVWSRTVESGKSLATRLHTIFFSDLRTVPHDSDFYILAVADDAVGEVAKELSGVNGVLLHTAGGLPVDVLEKYSDRTGVLYPLQTINKTRDISFSEVPVLTEGNTKTTLEKITRLARSVSDRVYEIDSFARAYVHLAAVFANNFTNRMVSIAQELLKENQLDPDLLIPLLMETAAKWKTVAASEAQTGPAMRNDKKTMEHHLSLMKDHPEWKKLYTFISRSIKNQGF